MTRHTVDSLQAIGIAPWAVLVTLNGDAVSGCVAVDEDAGYIERYARTLTSLKGGFLVEKGDLVVETLHGKVIVWLISTDPGRWPHALPRPSARGRVLLQEAIAHAIRRELP